MSKRLVTFALCLLAVMGLVLSSGCRAFTPEKTQRYHSVVRQDLDMMEADAVWILGLDEPSISHEDTFPPYRF